MVDGFLARTGAASLDPRGSLQSAGVAETVIDGALDARGRWRTFPHRQGTDGFFAALFHRPPRPERGNDSGYNTGAVE